jgi:murein DD-endopeptidase MepM/ murein hydrolase activator NlpD
MLLTCLLLAQVMPPAHAAKPNKHQLKQRKATIQSKIAKVQQQLRKVRAREAQTRTQLRSIEHQVRVARGQLHTASTQLQQKQTELHHANTLLSSARHTFSTTQDKVGTRLVAAYQRGDQGYLEFLLTSHDFGDMLERMQMSKFMMLQDRHALDDLQQRKNEYAGRQHLVAEKTREVAIWRQQVAILHQRTEVKHYLIAKNMAQVHEQLMETESEYNSLMRTSSEITAMLLQMERTPAGRRRYNKVYIGSLGGGGLPVHGARITSPFGWRIHPITHSRRMHTGVDLAAPIGTPITAAGGGEVIFAGRKGGYGNAVMIDHGHGKTTLYGHMSSFCVRAGEVVARGQLIGRVGSTGFSTGPHCHFEVRINGVPVNPLAYY